MHSLEPPDIHHLSAAIGWLELGNHAEARLELAKVSDELRKNPDVLEVNWQVAAAEQNWTSALAAARSLVEVEPDRSTGWLHQAYALRRVPSGGLEAAWEALLPAVERFPKEPTIPYNLSCYACQLGRLDEAREWLRKALSVGSKAKIKLMAMGDGDLKVLWDEIKDW